MQTSVSAFETTAAVADDLKQPTQMTESETDKVSGGAPKADVGNAYGAGHGWGFDDRGGGNGKGWDRNNENGRF
jgi:hypothetical protein